MQLRPFSAGLLSSHQWPKRISQVVKYPGMASVICRPGADSHLQPPSVAVGSSSFQAVNTTMHRLRGNAILRAIRTEAETEVKAASPQQQPEHLNSNLSASRQQQAGVNSSMSEQQQAAQDMQQQSAALAAPAAVGVQSLLKAATKVLKALPPRIRGLILLNIMTFVLGTNWVVVKESNAAFDPVVFTAIRFTLAAAAFAPFLGRGLASKPIRRAGMEIGLWTALGYIAQSWALCMTPASRASLLSTFTVIAVPGLAGLSGQKIKPLVWACGIAALLGTALLEQGGGEPPNAGDLLSIVSALFFAMQLFRTERTSRELPDGSSVPLMAVIVSTVAAASVASATVVHWQDAAAAASSLWHVLSAGVHALTPGHHVAGDNPQPLYELLYTSFCSTDLVLLLELKALQDVSSTEAALVYSLEPVSGALMAYAFLGERWGTLGWCGAAIILLASVATQLGGAMEEDQESPPTAS